MARFELFARHGLAKARSFFLTRLAAENTKLIAPLRRHLSLIGFVITTLTLLVLLAGIAWYLRQNSQEIYWQEVDKREVLKIEALALKNIDVIVAAQSDSSDVSETLGENTDDTLNDKEIRARLEFEDSFLNSEEEVDIYANLLHPHPDPTLLETNEMGKIPRIAIDGRKPWQVYARPSNSLETRPQISIIVTRLGLSKQNTEKAIMLPGDITLAFTPYARKLSSWIDQSRANGHEVMLMLPMEPTGFPKSDPGPLSLYSSLKAEQNQARLHWILAQTTGYIGVVNFLGSRFLNERSLIQPVIKNLQQRGLIFLEDGQALNPISRKIAAENDGLYITSDAVLDKNLDRDDIIATLAKLERLAKTKGSAVGIARPYPVTLSRIRLWARTLNEKGIALVPLSAVMNTYQAS